MAHTPSRKNRRRGRASTLTLTAALLAVVWVVHMRMILSVPLSPTYAMHLSSGVIDLTRLDTPISPRTFSRISTTFYDSRQWQVGWWFGRWQSTIYGQTRISWYAPLWPFILLTGGPGVWMLIKTRQHTNPNACPACGYDRTGLPQSSTGPAACPECGPECGKG